MIRKILILLFLCLSSIIFAQINGKQVIKDSLGFVFKVNYKNDTLHGAYKIYNNKKLLQKGQLNMGYRNGAIITFLTNDRVFVANYNKGKRLNYEYFCKKEMYSKKIFNDSIENTIINIINDKYDTAVIANPKIRAYEGYIDSFEFLIKSKVP